MTSTAPARPFIRVRGRSFIALALVPEPPIMDWLAELDAQLQKSPAFFDGRPVIVDLAAAKLHGPGLRAFLHELQERGIRVIGLEGIDPAGLGPGGGELPPMLTGGRPAGVVEPVEAAPAEPEEAPDPEPPSLLVDHPVRSGQAIHFPRGDVIVVGSVASGAEIVAGGSIHVYGTLRGRAIAGLLADGRARVFCRRLEAELVAIDGVYTTADDMEPGLRGRAVQARLDGNTLVMAALD